jgi:hypothetical protein
MKRPALLLAALCLMASSLSALAQGNPKAQEQEQEKLPVYFRVKGDDAIGQRLGEIVRTALQRNKSLRVVAEPKDATLRFYMVTVNPGVPGTVYSLVSTLFDEGAHSRESYWTNLVGSCGQNVIESCANSILSDIEQALSSFQKQSQSWYVGQLKAVSGVPSIGLQQVNIPPLLDGVGSTPCSVLVKTFDDFAKEKTSEKQLGSTGQNQWLYGYLSAYNLQNAWRFKAKYGVFGSEDERKKTFSAWWIYDVCKANPKVTIQEVADEYIRKMLDRARTPEKK